MVFQVKVLVRDAQRGGVHHGVSNVVLVKHARRAVPEVDQLPAHAVIGDAVVRAVHLVRVRAVRDERHHRVLRVKVVVAEVVVLVRTQQAVGDLQYGDVQQLLHFQHVKRHQYFGRHEIRKGQVRQLHGECVAVILDDVKGLVNQREVRRDAVHHQQVQQATHHDFTHAVRFTQPVVEIAVVAGIGHVVQQRAPHRFHGLDDEEDGGRGGSGSGRGAAKPL